MNILIVSDNKFLVEQFHQILVEKKLKNAHQWDYACSPVNKALLNDSSLPVKMKAIVMKEQGEQLVDKYDLIFSLHCKQLFPAALVKNVKCINVHPGLNPYNRGWFPQVFSILNKKKSGATIHEIDEQLDHGAIIAQKEVPIESWDTSLTAYNKIQEAEIELLRENLENILSGNYTTTTPAEEGNVNLKKDFNELCEIDMQKQATVGETIDYLRAMTHGSYANAWFIDKATGKKVYVKVELKPED